VDQYYRLGDPLPRRMAVVRALRGLGDLLCIVPAVRALRSALPEAEIALVGLPWAQTFISRFNRYFDRLIEFPGFPGIPERTPSIAALPAFFAGIQDWQLDLALQMHGSGITSNAFTVMLGARHTAGFYLPGLYNPDPERFLPYPDHLPEVRRHLALMEFLGVPSLGEALEFPLYDADWEALAAVPETADLQPGRYVCVHPGAHESARRWPVDRFAAVADALADQGYRIVLTGTAGERDLTRAVARRMAVPALDLAGRTSLGAMAALLSRARLLICNDTGISHLAAALQVPSVIVFIASNPGRWAPLDRQRHRAVGRPGTGVLAGHDDGDMMGRPDMRLDSRCLREGCSGPTGTVALQPLEATVDGVLAQALALLTEATYAA
jgi:ADP-heptose:LPS heptosyltransferase